MEYPCGGTGSREESVSNPSTKLNVCLRVNEDVQYCFTNMIGGCVIDADGALKGSGEEV